VLAPSTFMEHAIIASEWTRVQSRRRRSTPSPSSPTTACRRKGSKQRTSLMWIKKSPARPTLGPPVSNQPSVIGSTATPPRRSGLHRILGFH
jgi:hypothetical protein